MISDSPASLRQEKAAMSITIKLVGQAGDFFKVDGISRILPSLAEC